MEKNSDLPGEETPKAGSQNDPGSTKENSSPEDRQYSQVTLPEDSQPKQATAEMEIHHHDHVHDKIKWRAYLFQFLMLFLAVTLGFFVENRREHYIERKRAGQYAALLINDLSTDTANLQTMIIRTNLAIKNLDTLSMLMRTSASKPVPSGKIYWFGLWGGFGIDYVSNDATFQQMRNSGSLRFMTNSSLVEKISRYDLLNRSISNKQQEDATYAMETRKSRALLLDYFVTSDANDIVQENYIDFRKARIDSFIERNPPLLNDNKVLLNQYLELCRGRKQYWQKTLKNAIEANALARELIAALKKEYYLP